jgi:integrase
MTQTLAEACTAWCLYRDRMADLGLVATSTNLNQSQIVAASIIPALGAIELDSLRKSDIDIWVGERLASRQPVTVRAELNVLRQILNWCVDEQMLGVRPRLPTVQVPNTEKALPSDDAFVWALAAVPENHRAALELMMMTGLSPHEAERLQVRDFHPTVAGIGAALGIGRRPDFKVKTASRSRWVPLNKRALELWVVVTEGKRPLDPALPSSCAMQKALARARAADPTAPEDARRITPKLMRQWFASHVSDDVPEKVLQRLLGHSPGSKITRRHYVRSTDAALAKAVGGLHA